MSLTSSHAVPRLQALLVTFLWSTSWVLIKLGLADIPALTFAGLRYALAFLLLLPFALRGEGRTALRALCARDWGKLAALGVVLYTLTQGAQFLGLSLLPAASVSLILSFSPAVVAIVGGPWLGERPSARQWAGIGVFVAGAALYFGPGAFPNERWLGLVVAVLGALSNAGAAVLGRAVNRGLALPSIGITAVSMGIGAALLLFSGIAFQGLPPLAPWHWAIVAWLAAVNTAFAFTLWNHTLKRLSAMESSVLNNTMLIQIALLAWVFLGEGLGGFEIAGLALAAAGALLVQLRR